VYEVEAVRQVGSSLNARGSTRIRGELEVLDAEGGRRRATPDPGQPTPVLSRLGSGLGKDVLDLLASQVVSLTASMLLTLLTASVLGPGGRGVFALVIGSANLIAQAVSISLHVGAANAYRAGDGGAVPTQARLTAALATGVLVIGIPVSLALPDGGGDGFGRVEGILMSVLAALAMLQTYTTRTIQGVGLAAEYRRLTMVNALLGLTLGLAGAYATGSPVPVLIGWAVASAVTSLTAIPTLRRLSSHRDAIVPTRRVVADSGAAHLGTLGQQLLIRADIPILGAFAPLSQVGLYSVASPVATLVVVFAETASLATFGFGRGDNTPQARTQRHRRILRGYLYVAIPAGLLVIAGGVWILPLLLPEFSGTALLIALLVPGTVVQGIARIGLSSLIAQSRKRASLAVGIGSAVLSIAYFPAIIVAGAVGAAVASSVIYAAQAVLVSVVLARPQRDPVVADG
jgi:O-antigen/teichoic acid export membrane protein